MDDLPYERSDVVELSTSISSLRKGA